MQVGFDKRWFLIGLISLTQLVGILGLGSIALRGLELRIRDRAYQRALDDNAKVLVAVSKQIRRQGLRNFEAPSNDLQALQNLIGAIRLPHDGLVSVARLTDGRIICHPAFQRGADHVDASFGKAALPTADGGFQFKTVEHDACGMAEIDGRKVLWTALVLEDLGIVVQAYQDEEVLRAAVREELAPMRSIGLISAMTLALLTAAVSVVIVRRYDHRLETINRRLEHKVHDRSTALMKTRNAVIFGLAKLAESRDNDTGKHLERIRKYVTLLALKLKTSHALSNEQVEDLAFASSLHDIGKVGIPDAILLKRGPLTTEERVIIERHADIGGRCLEAIQRQLGNDDFLELAKLIAFTHHERWDGTGYPFGLSKERIPLAGRIVAVADVYDALTTKRPYKRAFPHEEAYQMIVSGAGTQFDPDVVAAFVHKADEFAQIATDLSDVREDDGLEGSGGILNEMCPVTAADLVSP